MSKTDLRINSADHIICNVISKQEHNGLQMTSQNILSQIRNLLDATILKIVHGDKDVEPEYEVMLAARRELNSYKKPYRFITEFHDLVQISLSHYVPSDDGAERLLLKYFSYLIKLKHFMFERYGVSILHNLEDLCLDSDEDTREYYRLIGGVIDRPASKSNNFSNDRYYIFKNKTIFIDGKVYYEVVFSNVNSGNSKIGRLTAYSNLEIFDNYAVKLQIEEGSITFMGVQMPIYIITNWQVSIRPCELNNYSKIFGASVDFRTSHHDYSVLMDYLTSTCSSLTELLSSDDSEVYNEFIGLFKNLGSTRMPDIFEESRNLIRNNLPGCNVLRYLLHCMNNNVIKSQWGSKPSAYLSSLMLSNRCIPFDTMPFATSLANHNPSLHDLIRCIRPDNRSHELLARHVKVNCEQNGIMFTDVSSLKSNCDVDSLIEKHNKLVYYKHTNRILEKFENYLYFSGYLRAFKSIYLRLNHLSNCHLDSQDAIHDDLLDVSSIDCSEKKEILSKIFSDSRVAMIHGPAGTGKTTLINYISKKYSDFKKTYLAKTNPAVNNLKSRVNAPNTSFYTIDSYLGRNYGNRSCDLLIVDECSTISNDDMQNLLGGARFKLLLLVGDVYQIESIRFGNWFHYVPSFLRKDVIFSLNNTHRTTDPGLIKIWNSFRSSDGKTLEHLTKNFCVSSLNESIFDTDPDQIILCLNYDGPYGINNINRILQIKNKNKSFVWNLSTYKVGDPVLFNDVWPASSKVYNNMKGTIVDISMDENIIQFDVMLGSKVDFSINNVHLYSIVGEMNGKTVIRFSVNRFKDSDGESDAIKTVVPFNVSYAVSIHKSQGLEYDSVKIVMADDVSELITRNIFYTAITRARKKLTIYSSKETINKVLERSASNGDHRELRAIGRKLNIRPQYHIFK